MKTIDYKKPVNIDSIELEGIDTKDYPDFCDAFISYAEFADGIPLNDQELDEFNDQNSCLVNELVFKQLF